MVKLSIPYGTRSVVAVEQSQHMRVRTSYVVLSAPRVQHTLFISHARSLLSTLLPHRSQVSSDGFMRAQEGHSPSLSINVYLYVAFLPHILQLYGLQSSASCHRSVVRRCRSTDTGGTRRGHRPGPCHRPIR